MTDMGDFWTLVGIGLAFFLTFFGAFAGLGLLLWLIDRGR
jgi:hypothetical protein